MDLHVIGILAFLAAVLASRFITEKALRFLDDAQKTALVDGLSGYRIYFIVPVILIIVLYFAGMSAFPSGRGAITTLCLGLLVLYVIASNIIVFRKLVQLKLPRAYLQRFAAARLILYAALVFFFWAFVSASPTGM